MDRAFAPREESAHKMSKSNVNNNSTINAANSMDVAPGKVAI